MTKMTSICPISIQSVYAWVDNIPTIEFREKKKLLCTISFNEPTKLFEIIKIEFENASILEKFNIDIKQVNKYSFEKRNNELIIRNGPEWIGGSSIRTIITIKYNDNTYVLNSNYIKIQEVC